MTEILLWKFISIILLIFGVYFFGFAPLLIGNSVTKATLSVLSSFSGGVLIGTTFIHLFPEVSQSADKFRCSLGISEDYPIGELVTCVGLIAVMVIEYLVEEYERALHKGEIINHTDEDESSELIHDHSSHFVTDTSSGWGSYILVLALSIHSVLEGMAVGFAESKEAVVTLLLSIIIHEVLLAFTLGLKLFQDDKTVRQFVASLSFFVISCPVGVAIGMGVTASSIQADNLHQIVFIMKALATGTFIQVTFMEIIGPEFHTRYTSQLYKMLSLALGFIFICVVMYYLHDKPLQNFCEGA